MFSCPLSHEGSAVPASLANQCCLLKQPSNLPGNPRASFPVTRDSKKHHPFPILIMAERVSFLVSDSPKHVQVFLLELANFQAELPIKISLNFNTFSLALELWKQLQAASFPGSPFQEGCKFVFPGTTIPTRQFIFPQTRNQGSLGLLHLLKGFLFPFALLQQTGSRRGMWWGARHPSQHSSCPTTALCIVRGEHLRSGPEGTTSTFIELHHPKQKWCLKGWLVLNKVFLGLRENVRNALLSCVSPLK